MMVIPTYALREGLVIVTGRASSSLIVAKAVSGGGWFFAGAEGRRGSTFLDKVQQTGNKLCALVANGTVFFLTLIHAR